ncbi:MAG: DUF1737 domain-containing protein [Holophagaceae bacterium]|nr:DUF1737 domain-containing protein [Holophagaceae bacterium]MBK8726297.1 DUF1737 domain-containing protein [Holophagaceae bacterium]
MGNIIEYKVIHLHSQEAVEKAVNQGISEGWEPSGSLQVVTFHNANPWWIQAMVKRAQ